MVFRTQKGILHCFHEEVGSWCPLLSSQVGLLLISFDFMRRVSSSIGLTAPDHEPYYIAHMYILSRLRFQTH